MPDTDSTRTILGRGSWGETTRIAEVLRKETVGGALLLLATVVALVWVNSPAGDSYTALRDYRLGPQALHLDLSLGTWAADGLLAIFFFVVGLELKREFVAGDLRDPARAALPILAALGGVVVPAGIYVAVNLNTGGGALMGWAVPTATDIAFALAILAIVSTHLPTALRTFLLTLAVVDDLVAVTIIAVFYTTDLKLLPLAARWFHWLFSGSPCSAGSAPGGCSSRWPPPLGYSSTSPASTPPSRACSWASRFR